MRWHAARLFTNTYSMGLGGSTEEPHHEPTLRALTHALSQSDCDYFSPGGVGASESPIEVTSVTVT